jgi:hypothetical protein
VKKLEESGLEVNVATELQRKGLQAVAVQIPLSSLSDDAATVQRFLKRSEEAQEHADSSSLARY